MSRLRDLTSTELLMAQRVLSEHLAGRRFGSSLEDAVLRTCLGAVEYALRQSDVDTPIPRYQGAET